MRLRSTFFLVFACLAGWGVLLAQKPFHDYMPELAQGEHESTRAYLSGQMELPEDWDVPGEWTRARLKFESAGILHYPDTGYMGWATDYPMGDRNFQKGLKRLTLIDTTSVEHVVEFGDDDIFNWPFLYAVEPGHWNLFNDEADQLREYLDRGGFLMTDDFHGTIEWENFVKHLRKVYGSRPILDIANEDPIFHVIYNLGERTQIPGKQFLGSGVPYEFDGFRPAWRAIRDSKGRVVVAICHNMDLSDAIENANDPEYPELWSSTAFRIVANYVVYDLTH